MKRLPLANVYQLIEPGPVVLSTTARRGRPNVMTMSWHGFILEVLQAWTDPTQKRPKTIHHQGYGRFVVDGRRLRLKSRMR